MWEAITSAAVTIALACLGWVYSISNRLSVAETKIEAFEKWLERVEIKLDRAIEGR